MNENRHGLPLTPGPSPHRMGRGENFNLCAATQGGARSSLALGYFRLAPTGRQLEPTRVG